MVSKKANVHCRARHRFCVVIALNTQEKMFQQNNQIASKDAAFSPQVGKYSVQHTCCFYISSDAFKPYENPNVQTNVRHTRYLKPSLTAICLVCKCLRTSSGQEEDYILTVMANDSGTVPCMSRSSH